jgi:hypothetical protein
MNTEAEHGRTSSEELANNIFRNTYPYNSTNNFRIGVKWTKNQ